MTQKEFEMLENRFKQEALASIGASHLADKLRIVDGKINEDGSITFGFVANDNQPD